MYKLIGLSHFNKSIFATDIKLILALLDQYGRHTDLCVGIVPFEILVEVGLEERTRALRWEGAFSSLRTRGLSATVESAACTLFISCSSTFAGRVGWNADFTTSIGSSSDSSVIVASCIELTSDFESALDLSGLALAILLGLPLCLLLVGESLALDVSIEETLLCKCLNASYGLMLLFSDNSGGNDFIARSAGCGPKGRRPFGGKNAPGGGIKPPVGKLAIAGAKGKSSAPGNVTGGVVIAPGPPVDNRNESLA